MVLTGSMTFHLSGNCEVNKSALLYATPTQGGKDWGEQATKPTPPVTTKATKFLWKHLHFSQTYLPCLVIIHPMSRGITITSI